MPSWASISSNPRLTSSRLSECETNGSTSMSPASQRSISRGHAVAALDAAERRARHAPAGDQQPRHDVERLALAGHAAHRGQAPAHPRRLDGLAHDGDEAGRLERVVEPEAAGHLQQRSDGVGAAGEHVGRALAAGQLQPLGAHVHADDPLGALQPRAGDRAEADHARPEDGDRRALADGGGVHRRAQAGGQAAGEQAGAVQRRVGRDLGQGDLGHHGRLGERRGAHEVAHRLAAAATGACVPSGRKPRFCCSRIARQRLVSGRARSAGTRRTAARTA